MLGMGSRLIPLLLIGLVALRAAASIVVSEFATDSRVVDLAASGDRVYLLNGALQIFDLADPLHPELTGSLELRIAERLRIGESVVFAWTPLGAGLNVVDVSNPAAPAVASHLLENQRVQDVASFGSVAHVAVRGPHGSDPVRYVSYDLSDPFEPVLLADVPVDRFRPRFASIDSLLVACDGVLEIRDASGSLPLPELASVALGGVCKDLRIVEDLIYLIVEDELQIFEIADARNPQRLSAHPIDSPFGIEVSGDFAFVSSAGGLVQVDVSAPTLPVTVGLNGIYGSALTSPDADRLYMAATRGVIAVDITHSGSPVELSVMETDGRFAVVHRGDRLYALGFPGRLCVADVESPRAPRELGCQQVGSRATDLSLDGALATVGSESDGIRAVDLSDEAFLALRGHYRPPDGARAAGVDLRRRLAYATALDRLDVVDFSDPDLPERIGFLDLDLFPVAVEARRSLAFVSGGPRFPDGDAGFRIVDVARPETPAIIGALPLQGIATRMAIRGDRAYLAARDAGFLVLDVSDPTSPRQLGRVPAVSSTFTSFTRDVSVSGRFAYTAEGGYGIRVIDVSDPENPLELGGRVARLGPLGSPRVERVAAHHGVAFVGDSLGFLRIFDFREMLSGGIRIELRRIPARRARGRERVRLVLFGTASIHPGDIDVESLGLGPEAAAPLARRRLRVRDVDADGHRDLVASFLLDRKDVSERELCLTGRLRTGRVFEVCGPLQGRSSRLRSRHPGRY